MVNIDQREIASHNAGHAVRAGVDRPAALWCLELSRMRMGIKSGPPSGEDFNAMMREL
jgi:hypothetical protein